MARFRPPVDRAPPESVQPALAFGPEPFGAAVADNIQGAYGADMSGQAGQPGMVKIARTGLAEPAFSFAGDLGALQGRGGPVRLVTGAGRGTARWGRQPAFPSTTGPLSVQDLMGQMGI